LPSKASHALASLKTVISFCKRSIVKSYASPVANVMSVLYLNPKPDANKVTNDE